MPGVCAVCGRTVEPDVEMVSFNPRGEYVCWRKACTDRVRETWLAELQAAMEATS